MSSKRFQETLNAIKVYIRSVVQEIENFKCVLILQGMFHKRHRIAFINPSLVFCGFASVNPLVM